MIIEFYAANTVETTASSPLRTTSLSPWRVVIATAPERYRQRQPVLLILSGKYCVRRHQVLRGIRHRFQSLLAASYLSTLRILHWRLAYLLPNTNNVNTVLYNVGNERIHHQQNHTAFNDINPGQPQLVLITTGIVECCVVPSKRELKSTVLTAWDVLILRGTYVADRANFCDIQCGFRPFVSRLERPAWRLRLWC